MNADGTTDTSLRLGDGSAFQVDLLGVSGQSTEEFYAAIDWA